MKFILFFLIIASPAYPFSYDSAIYKAQKGNWQDAHSALNNIIIHNPDNADAVYDAGVAAYNVGNKCQAATCFKRAAECSGDKNICFRAHFNAGNMYVDEKNLKAALAEYDKALAIEPDNEYARHNRDRVKQMLQEEEKKKDQKEEDEQEEKDQQDKQDQNKQNQKQDGNDQQNQSQKGDDQKSKSGDGKQKDGKQQKNDSSSDESNDESSDQKTEGDREQQKDAAQQRAEHGNDKKEEQKNSGKNEKRNNKDELDKQSQNAQKEGKEQQGDKHGTTPQQANVSEHNKSNVSPEDGQEQAIADPWLLKILNNQEMHDKAVNKQLMEAKIRQHGGKNGQQNCW
jgi:Ca-activated chloride channel homolog